MDLNLRPRSDPVTGYVAMSRFKRADDVIILQPFELTVFQKGVSEEANLLLEHLRGKDITGMVQEKEARDKVKEDDRKRMLKELRAQRLAKTKEDITPEAKKRQAGQNMTAEAKKRKSGQGKPRSKPFTCSRCGVDKARSEYPEWTWRDRDKRQARG